MVRKHTPTPPAHSAANNTPAPAPQATPDLSGKPDQGWLHVIPVDRAAHNALLATYGITALRYVPQGGSAQTHSVTVAPSKAGSTVAPYTVQGLTWAACASYCNALLAARGGHPAGPNLVAAMGATHKRGPIGPYAALHMRKAAGVARDLQGGPVDLVALVHKIAQAGGRTGNGVCGLCGATHGTPAPAPARKARKAPQAPATPQAPAPQAGGLAARAAATTQAIAQANPTPVVTPAPQADPAAPQG